MGRGPRAGLGRSPVMTPSAVGGAARPRSGLHGTWKGPGDATGDSFVALHEASDAEDMRLGATPNARCDASCAVFWVLPLLLVQVDAPHRPLVLFRIASPLPRPR